MNLLSEESFYWETDEPHTDNMETMYEFLEEHLPEDCEIVEHNGTYAEVKQGEKVVGIHASGNGDFKRHKVEFEEVI